MTQSLPLFLAFYAEGPLALREPVEISGFEIRDGENVPSGKTSGFPELGLGADVGRGKLAGSFGLRRWSGAWSDMALPMSATSYRGWADLAYRETGDLGGVTVFGMAGAGLSASRGSVSWFQPRFSVGPHLQVAGGLVLGTGDLRTLIGLRADTGLQLGSWGGSVEAAGGTQTWTWYPGYGAIRAMVGITL